MEKKTRRGNGMASYRKRTQPNGKVYWEGRCTIGYNDDGYQVQKSFYGKTQREVQEKVTEALDAVNKGIYQDASKVTVSSWIREYLDTYMVCSKPRTKESYEIFLKNHITPQIGEIKLPQLTNAAVQEFINKEDLKYSPKTVRGIAVFLKQTLDKAVANHLIKENPAEGVKLRKVKKAQMRVLSRSETEQFLIEIEGTTYENLLIATLFMGTRLGEIVGLRWKDVDFEAGTVHIGGQLQKVVGAKDQYQYVETKTGNERTIVPAPFVMSALKEELEKQEKWKAEFPSVWQESGYVFVNQLGLPLKHHTVYHNLKKIAEKMGIPELRFHDLRHSFVVASSLAGIDIKTISETCGHSSVAFTMDRYGHVIDEMKRTASDKLEDYINSLKG